MEEEEAYLRSYASSRRAVVVLARWKGEVIGASTGVPMSEAERCFQTPLVEAGESLDEWFYFGESVLHRAFRGQGIGHRFFDEREAHAVELGFVRFGFCSVIREHDHPLKPGGYRPHDAFWTKRGYRIRDDWRVRLRWKQVDREDAGTENELVYWTREGT
ncbi:GNAT family N-acetyltransferase [Haloferula sp.]|uniref:GNAT family N-acetyltransferase n=1 Tax=Haloferula sp. TaxID=2497595 RepID=UPI003C782DE4